MVARTWVVSLRRSRSRPRPYSRACVTSWSKRAGCRSTPRRVRRIFPPVLSRFSSSPCLRRRMIGRRPRARPSASSRRTRRAAGHGVPHACRMAGCRASGEGRRGIAVPRPWELRQQRRDPAARASSTGTAILSSSVVPNAATRARRLACPPARRTWGPPRGHGCAGLAARRRGGPAAEPWSSGERPARPPATPGSGRAPLAPPRLSVAPRSRRERPRPRSEPPSGRPHPPGRCGHPPAMTTAPSRPAGVG